MEKEQKIKLNQIIDFLDQELRPNTSWSIQEEYPTVFCDNNIGNIHFIENDQEIISHAVVKEMLIKTPAAILKVAGIGSVVTNRSFRSQGHSTEIIQSCLETAKNNKCDIAILWTDLYDFYTKMGFELAGSEIALILEEKIEADKTGLKFLNSNKVSAEAILKLYNQHTVNSHRTLEEVQQFLAIPNSKIFTAWDQNNQLKAYAITGKGADLTNYIHEWGGNTPDLLALISQMQELSNETLTLISPSHSYNIIRQLSAQKATLNDGYLGMIKIVNTKDLFFKILRYTRNIGIEDFIIEECEGGYKVGSKDLSYIIASENDLVKLIFGPQKASELGGAFDKETCETLDKIFPLPLWIWGWDSV